MHRPTLHPPPGLNGFPKLIDQKVQAQLLPLPLDALPAELVLAILARLTSPEDILCCKLVSRRVYQLISANATKLARSMAECAIRQNENCWKVEMSRNGGKKWQMEVEQDQEQEQDDAFRPFWHFELSTIALSGPFIANGISLLNRRLRCNRQNRIRNVFVENFEFVDVQSTQTLFGQLIRQKCQRLHLKNCRFNTHFVDHSLLPEQSLNSLDFSLAQFKLEAENCECLPKNFVLWTMAKMAGDVRHRIRRPHSSPLLWDSIVPLESATERSAVYAQNLSTKFLFSLAAFVLNWQNVPMPPSFHIRLQRCPRNFSTTFGAFCDRLGISQMNLVFPSLSHRTAHIQGKQNQEKGFFELFSLKDVPSSPVVFCLVSQWTNEYF
uniref:F-box domain-containing protein n=1 Tax=Globodera rostochiensis TaxID=31243 RepID=A0A914IA81_GLORO